jgi:hypothetical protein
MAGGGSQAQAFFGNKSGYIAILYLPNTLMIQWQKNDKFFNGKTASFSYPKLTVRLHSETYPDEEIDEDYDLVYNS